ncbi:hypothetical protein D3C72_1951430 [compost metagenome]
MRPPPASASSGNARAIHVHHPVGAAVASSPHRLSKMATAQMLCPTNSNVPAVAAISRGIMIKV